MRATRAEFIVSVRGVLPVALISPTNLFAGAGGIAIGDFAGQGLAVIRSVSEARRKLETAISGFAALLTMIGLILLSKNGG